MCSWLGPPQSTPPAFHSIHRPSHLCSYAHPPHMSPLLGPAVRATTLCFHCHMGTSAPHPPGHTLAHQGSVNAWQRVEAACAGIRSTACIPYKQAHHTHGLATIKQPACPNKTDAVKGNNSSHNSSQATAKQRCVSTRFLNLACQASQAAIKQRPVTGSSMPGKRSSTVTALR